MPSPVQIFLLFIIIEHAKKMNKFELFDNKWEVVGGDRGN
jgi:hypothetical protein